MVRQDMWQTKLSTQAHTRTRTLLSLSNRTVLSRTGGRCFTRAQVDWCSVQLEALTGASEQQGNTYPQASEKPFLP